MAAHFILSMKNGEPSAIRQDLVEAAVRVEARSPPLTWASSVAGTVCSYIGSLDEGPPHQCLPSEIRDWFTFCFWGSKRNEMEEPCLLDWEVRHPVS